jgi:outer membrane protein insertion porin family
MRAIAIIVLSLAAEAGAEPADGVDVVGAKAFEASQLRAAAFGSDLFDGTGAVDDATLQTDLLRLSSFYWDHGYASVKLGTPTTQPWYVAVPVDEGDCYAIGRIAFSGELVGSQADQLALIQTREGMTFSRTMVATDRETLIDHYRDAGYAFVQVMPYTEITQHPARIGITFDVEHGPLAHVEGIAIHNASGLTAQQIRGAITIAHGALFSLRDLAETKRRIAALGVAKVDIRTQRGSEPGLVWLDVDVGG